VILVRTLFGSRNWGEQWVDCGGECDPCLSSYNGQLDPGEDGIDCGGDTGVDCGELCGDGLLNGNEEEIDLWRS